MNLCHKRTYCVNCRWPPGGSLDGHTGGCTHEKNRALAQVVGRRLCSDFKCVCWVSPARPTRTLWCSRTRRTDGSPLASSQAPWRHCRCPAPVRPGQAIPGPLEQPTLWSDRHRFGEPGVPGAVTLAPATPPRPNPIPAVHSAAAPIMILCVLRIALLRVLNGQYPPSGFQGRL